MTVRAVLLMVCISLSTRSLHGQSLLKHGDQGCMKRIEDVEQRLATTVQRLERQITENRRVSDIGFVAFLSTNFNTTANGTIIFDEVGNEGGGGYNNRTGVFTVPVAGVYHIYFSILSEGGSASEINLMLHYRAKTGYLLRAYIAASQKYHTPSASVYFRLDVGNKVYLKASRSGAILDSDRFSSFGAQLITY